MFSFCFNCHGVIKLERNPFDCVGVCVCEPIFRKSEKYPFIIPMVQNGTNKQNSTTSPFILIRSFSFHCTQVYCTIYADIYMHSTIWSTSTYMLVLTSYMPMKITRNIYTQQVMNDVVRASVRHIFRMHTLTANGSPIYFLRRTHSNIIIIIPDWFRIQSLKKKYLSSFAFAFKFTQLNYFNQIN